jgi:hypothetical protein
MPAKKDWTAPQDAQLRRMRTQGATWDEIAAVLGLGRWTVIERGRHLGVRPPPPDFVPEPEDPEREPMPSGDPRSWDAINAGTVLEGQPYPLPVFRR